MRTKPRTTKNDLFACLDRLKRENAVAFSLPFFSVDELAASVKKKAPQYAKLTTRPNLIFWLRKNSYIYRELHHKKAHLRVWSHLKDYKRFRFFVSFRENFLPRGVPQFPKDVFIPFFFPNGLPAEKKNSKKS